MGKPALADCERDVIELLRDMTSDWDTGFGGELSGSTSLIADLGFESIDVVHLVTALEQHYDRSDLPFEKLLMKEGHYVDDLTIAQIAQFLHAAL